MEKQSFIVQSFLLRCAALGESRQVALEAAEEDWSFIEAELEKRPRKTQRISDEEVERRVLEAVADSPIVCKPVGGPRVREILFRRMRERYGIAVSTARLQLALQELLSKGLTYRSPDRRDLKITELGRARLGLT